MRATSTRRRSASSGRWSAPTYDDQARAQIETAQGGDLGDPSARLDALIHGGDTWTIA